ncbi:DUF305 domain-containing protein [Sphingomonas sp. RB56-2]|uniref:DUF305 domain-containing protein n=1 Tax=Sphingomonas brevis TaxID=2908206 RepID=A0ABT0S8V0_9SPHN|nr:DUF305 domain-containing protein [Sphingomonas brevis]MCL6740557.1 DUF305 domain-containing protein [Sphingomonas brevis]
MSREMVRHHYLMLGVNLLLSLIIMYVAMFAMIWSFGEFVQNINFFYMALVMWAPMAAVMLLTMRAMYPNKKLNGLLYLGFAAVFILSMIGIREQSLVGDQQFLRSMIPHHSGAVLMCEKAKITDPEIQSLCQGIISSQTSEIDQMKAILERK